MEKINKLLNQATKLVKATDVYFGWFGTTLVWLLWTNDAKTSSLSFGVINTW